MMVQFSYLAHPYHPHKKKSMINNANQKCKYNEKSNEIIKSLWSITSKENIIKKSIKLKVKGDTFVYAPKGK